VRLGSAWAPEAVRLRWGLIPSWADDPKIGNKLVNARSETVAEKPSFRSAWRHRRRCLVPADGFFEWQAVGKRKQPYLLRRPGGRPFAFTGRWAFWKASDGKPVESCTILTTAANAAVAQLQDRMRVMLSMSAVCDSWLAADDVEDLLPTLPVTSIPMPRCRSAPWSARRPRTVRSASFPWPSPR
jgi:putative SOS response-associated peptidase YedK